MVRSKVSRNHAPRYHGGLCSLKHIIAKSNKSGHRGSLRYIENKRGSSKSVSIVYTLKAMLLAPFSHYVLCLGTEFIASSNASSPHSGIYCFFLQSPASSLLLKITHEILTSSYAFSRPIYFSYHNLFKRRFSARCD